MKQLLFAGVLFFSQFLLGQEKELSSGVVHEKIEKTIATETGEVIIKKESVKNGRISSDHSLSVFGILNLSGNAVTDVMKTGEPLKKGQLEFIFDKACNLLDIRVVESTKSEIANQELKQFAADLLLKIRQGNHTHLFQFDNELGFVNEDSCSDNLIVSVALKAR